MNEGIQPQDRVTELIEQQTAISEVPRAIASSPHADPQPGFWRLLFRGGCAYIDMGNSRRVTHAPQPAIRDIQEPGAKDS
jgi:hypothetical protein